MTGKLRADELLVQKGLAPSRSKAKALIMAGEVRCETIILTRPAQLVSVDAPLEVAEKDRYVSRGGHKLAHALEKFNLDVTGMVALDIGASTGGFTDCLLQHDAGKVYAVDVGYGQLDYRLRTDPRVVVMERTNARYLERLPEDVDLIVIDVAFISLKLVLPPSIESLKSGGRIIALIKPQFEGGPDLVNRRGVVTHDSDREIVVRDILQYSESIDLRPQDLTRSPVVGPQGNHEFLMLLTREQVPTPSIEELIEKVFRDPV